MPGGLIERLKFLREVLLQNVSCHPGLASRAVGVVAFPGDVVFDVIGKAAFVADLAEQVLFIWGANWLRWRANVIW